MDLPIPSPEQFEYIASLYLSALFLLFLVQSCKNRVLTTPGQVENLTNKTSVFGEEIVEKSLRQLINFIREKTEEDKIIQEPEIVPFEELYDEELLRNSEKIGEGTYGEVFLHGSAVLKIVPVGGSKQVTVDEMLVEMAISRELGNIQANFVKLGKCQLTRGCYPKIFLELWDRWEEESENDRPNCFPPDQLYMVMEYTYGGKDLERTKLQNAEQGFAIFSQVAFSLAVAEEALQFEHRDIHWGNIVVRPTEVKFLEYKISDRFKNVETRGVLASIIDYSLSRLTCPKDGTILYNDASQDPTLFTGTGDYQFDIYREMRKHNENSWREFNPVTNVMWLHYLLHKLTSKVFYKTRKSNKHIAYLTKMKKLKSRILDYKSALDIAKHEF